MIRHLWAMVLVCGLHVFYGVIDIVVFGKDVPDDDNFVLAISVVAIIRVINLENAR